MPKVSVYLPDELYRRARDRGLKLSAITQAAVTRELDSEPNCAWIERVAARPAASVEADTPAILDEVREEFGT